MIRHKLRFLALAATTSVLACSGATLGQADPLDEAIETERNLVQFAQQSQKRIDQVSEETRTLVDEYRLVLDQIETLQIYNNQLEQLINSQEAEMASLNRQIDRVTNVEREVTPLMLRMVEALENFVELDVPFLKEERENRMIDLRELMSRANVTSSEKFRRVLEAYQIENEFGRTIEAYTQALDLEGDGNLTNVDVLRIGRVALLYQTPDRERTGMWDQAARQWVALDNDFRNSVRDGIRVARKQAAPDLLTTPVPAPEVAQ